MSSPIDVAYRLMAMLITMKDEAFSVSEASRRLGAKRDVVARHVECAHNYGHIYICGVSAQGLPLYKRQPDGELFRMADFNIEGMREHRIESVIDGLNSGKTAREIGHELGISESLVSVIKAKHLKFTRVSGDR